jgi:glutamate dehydrogenase (NADP+)
MLQHAGDTLKGKTVDISGSGNVAIYAAEKAQQLGAKVVTMSDSNGYVYDPNGIQLDVVKEIKEVRRGRIKEYTDAVSGSTYVEGKKVWEVPCDVALPCATQNELNLDAAKTLVANGCKYVAEGANMPCTREATDYFQEQKIPFMPGKASNAGGVATSALEMSQNSQRLSWTFEEVDEKLHQIMVDIYRKVSDAAARYGVEGNFVAGANIAGFEKVADAMKAQGIV